MLTIWGVHSAHVFCEVMSVFLSTDKHPWADEPPICVGLYEDVVVPPRQSLSSVPVCAKLYLLAFSWPDAPGYPSSPINVNALQRFSIQPEDKDEVAQPPAKLQGDTIPKSRRKIEYNTVGPSLLAEIDTMEVRGSFGRKIDTLVRHLLYLQFADAGAKSIVFSAWEDSLHSAQFTLLTRIRSIE